MSSFVGGRALAKGGAEVASRIGGLAVYLLLAANLPALAGEFVSGV